MTKTYKMTPEQLLAQKMNKRDELKKKWENNDAYAKLQVGYAEAAKAEYLKREAQVEAMQKRIDEGLEARREADELRIPHMKAIDEAPMEYLNGEEHQTRKARILELDTFYHDTMQAVARINNGLMH